MKYLLSKRQSKELANGKILRIAIPLPDRGVEGMYRSHDGTGNIPDAALANWFARQVDTDGANYELCRVGILEVPVNPLERGGGGLDRIFGAIVNAGNLPDTALTVRIVCVVAELAPRRESRGNYPTQWPARIRLSDGRELPPA